ncbi:MAG: type II secretion system protein [Planctomycetota bacterium]|jgi:hypothetical protein
MNGLRGTRGARAHRGLSRIEVLAIVAVIAIIPALAIPAARKARRNALAMQDATQLKQIGAAVVTFTRDWGAGFPLPSQAMLRREGAEEAPEDFTLNHSANIYSAMVMANYFTPQILVSPVEVSPHVRVMGAGGSDPHDWEAYKAVEVDPYDWEAYDPFEGKLWDDTFVMHIHDPAVGANGSYAHLAAVGERRRIPSTDPAVPLFGNRAPGPAPGAHEHSPTLRFYPPYDVWVGNVVFSDNHTATLENLFAGSPGDNIYAADGEHPMGPQAAADAFLAIYISATEFTVEDVYDPLE